MPQTLRCAQIEAVEDSLDSTEHEDELGVRDLTLLWSDKIRLCHVASGLYLHLGTKASIGDEASGEGFSLFNAQLVPASERRKPGCHFSFWRPPQAASVSVDEEQKVAESGSDDEAGAGSGSGEEKDELMEVSCETAFILTAQSEGDEQTWWFNVASRSPEGYKLSGVSGYGICWTYNRDDQDAFMLTRLQPNEECAFQHVDLARKVIERVRDVAASVPEEALKLLPAVCSPAVLAQVQDSPEVQRGLATLSSVQAQIRLVNRVVRNLYCLVAARGPSGLTEAVEIAETDLEEERMLTDFRISSTPDRVDSENPGLLTSLFFCVLCSKCSASLFWPLQTISSTCAATRCARARICSCRRKCCITCSTCSARTSSAARSERRMRPIGC